MDPDRFYRVFSDHDDLVTSLLARWEHEATDLVLDRVRAVSEDPVTRLRELTAPADPDVTVPLPMEGAVREWALSEPLVARHVDRVEQRRLAFVTELLVEAGVDEARASIRAELWYQSMTGMYAAGRQPRDARPEVVDELITMLTCEEGA